MNIDSLADAVERFCELPGPGGSEGCVRDVLIERWGADAEVHVDRIGNLAVCLGGSGNDVALVAHMDEIGWFVSHVRADGLLRAQPSQPSRGSRMRGVPLGHPALVLSAEELYVEGTFAAVTGHAIPLDGEAAAQAWWIDIGALSREEAVAVGIHVGSPVIAGSRVRRSGTRLVGKAMDDRALLAVLDAVASRVDIERLACRLWLVATVQEEIGTIGAAAVARSLRLDRAVTLDVAPAGDLPDQPEDWYDVRLGEGAVLAHRDAAVVYSRRLGRELRGAADRAGVPLKHGAFPFYASDGREFVRAGVETALLTVPVRYTHSAFETIALDDLAGLCRILESWLLTQG